MSFTVYRSSAGSGKTFTLVKEYLKLSLKGNSPLNDNYKQVLAITFTNKAATEMKSRILKALKEMATNIEPSTLHKVIAKETGESISSIKTKASIVHSRILHNYSDFAVCTIDSFVHRIIRAFSFDLNLPGNFDIEMNKDSLLEEAIHMLIEKAGENESLTKILMSFIEQKLANEKSWQVESDLLKFSEHLIDENSSKYVEQLKRLTIDDLLSVKSELDKYITQVNSNIKEHAKKALELFKEKEIDPADLYYKKNGIFGFFVKANRLDLKDLPGSHARKTIEEDHWYGKKVPIAAQERIENSKEEISAYYHAIINTWETEKEQYILFELLLKNIFPLVLLNEIAKNLEEYKKENSLIHISEFNTIISKIVMEQPVPFIYERLGERYKNFLIDEFQDTSVVQWQNLLPLIDNSLAVGNYNMLVGDGKQAIYRFRGGEVEQFANLPEVDNPEKNALITERESALKRNYKPMQLRNNFRSKSEVVEFNNTLFSSLQSLLNSDLSEVYTNGEQLPLDGNSGGYVELSFTQEKKEEKDILEYVTERIIRLKEEGYLYSDIAILCRTNKQGNVIANHLHALNIPVVSPDSLLLKSSGTVNFILSVLHFLHRSDDRIALTGIVQHMYDFEWISEKECQEAILQGASSCKELISEKASGSLLDRISEYSLYEQCENIVNAFDLNKDIYAQFFLEDVLSFQKKNADGYSGFIEHWNNENTQPSVVMPENTNAVKILTIHKSKGLEYEAVILPYADWRISNTKDYVWTQFEKPIGGKLKTGILPIEEALSFTLFSDIYQKEKDKSLLDSINLLYVACTRAVERLYIFAEKRNTDTKVKHTSINDLLNFFVNNNSMMIEEDSTLYHFGIKRNKIGNEGFGSQKESVFSEGNTRWRKVCRIKENKWSKVLREDSTPQLTRGSAYHAVLKQVFSVSDIEHAIQQCIAEGIIKTEEAMIIKERILALFRNKKIGELLSKKGRVMAEHEILVPNDKNLIPDRVIINENTATVIDFKTGEPNKKNNDQILEYGNLISKLGLKTDKLILLYIDKGMLEIVPSNQSHNHN